MQKRAVVISLGVLFGLTVFAGEPLGEPRAVRVGGLELSGVARVEGGFLVVDDELVGTLLFVSDRAFDREGPLESHHIKLERRRTSSQPHTSLPRLFAFQDLEDVASQEDEVYVLGSHAQTEERGGWVRRTDRECIIRAKWDRGDEELRVRSPHDSDGKRGLYSGLIDDLQRAAPDLEGGVNAEGLAVKDKQLYVGLRSPLDPDGKAIVVSGRTKALFGRDDGQPVSLDVLRLDLSGGGVRGLFWDELTQRLLVISGPTTDALTAPVLLWCCKEDGSELRQMRAFTRDEVAERGIPEALCRGSETELLLAFDGEGKPAGATLLWLPWTGPK